MKTLIIPDIHNRTHIAEHIIANERHDKVILLGDYFDSYGDECNLDLVRKTAQWFAWSVNQPNRIHLCGNHDIPYWFPKNRYALCPGFNHIKFLVVQEYVRNRDWEKLLFFYNLDNKWLLSHGGAHPGWISRNYKLVGDYLSDIQTVCNQLTKDTKEFLTNSGRNEAHWFTAWSRARSLTNYPGGLLWCDFDGDFHVILGVNQLVGHTYGDRVRWTYYPEGANRQKWHEGPNLKVNWGKKCSYNLCLDTGLQEYGVWNGTKLTIKSVSDLLKKKLISGSVGP